MAYPRSFSVEIREDTFTGEGEMRVPLLKVSVHADGRGTLDMVYLAAPDEAAIGEAVAEALRRWGKVDALGHGTHTVVTIGSDAYDMTQAEREDRIRLAAERSQHPKKRPPSGE